METIVIDNFKQETPSFVESDGKDNLHSQIDAIPVLYPQSDIFTNPRIDGTYGVSYPLYGWNNSFSLIDLTTQIPSISWDIFVDSDSYYISGIGDVVAAVDKKGNSVLLSNAGSYIGYKSTPLNAQSGIATKIRNFGNNVILSSDAYSDRFYYMPRDFSGSWTQVSLSAGTYIYDSLVFNNNLFLFGKNPFGGLIILRYNTSLSLVGSFIINTLGIPLGIVNYNNQYIAIFIRENNRDFMILWNGDVNSYSFDRYILPGRFISGISHDGTLFVLMNNPVGFSLYYFYGSGFKLVFENKRYNILNLSSPAYAGNRGILKMIGDYLIIHAGKRILFFSLQKKELFGIGYNNAMSFDGALTTFVEPIRIPISLYDYSFDYTFYLPGSSAGFLYYFKIDTQTTNYMGRSFFYRSNWIVLGKRIRLGNIKLYYTNTPTPNYYLNVKIGYIDEKTGGSIQYKDYNFLQSQLPASYKEFSVNIECTKFFIMVWTDPNINTASKSVKRVVIEYDRLE